VPHHPVVAAEVELSIAGAVAPSAVHVLDDIVAADELHLLVEHTVAGGAPPFDENRLGGCAVDGDGVSLFMFGGVGAAYHNDGTGGDRIRDLRSWIAGIAVAAVGAAALHIIVSGNIRIPGAGQHWSDFIYSERGLGDADDGFPNSR